MRVLEGTLANGPKAPSAGADSGRQDELRGARGGPGGPAVGNGVQRALDHQGGHGGVQAARPGLLYARRHCE